MLRTRSQRATYNVITSLLYEAVALVCNLILPRLIILTYGSAYNGITSSATQFLGFIEILNLGVAGATRVSLYKTLAANDEKGTSAIVKSTEQYMRKVSVVLVGFVIVLAIGYPLLVDTGYTFYEVSLLILAVGINSFGNYFFGATYTAFLSAAQCVYINNIFSIVTCVLNTAISVVLIKLGLSIQVVKLVSAAVFFLKPLLQRLYVSHKFNIDRYCQPDKNALSKKKSVMAHSVANIIHDNTDMVVLTVFCNVKIVSVYTVYNLVMNALKKTQSIFTSGTESIFGDMWVKGEQDKIKKYLGLYEFIIMILVSTVFSTATAMILPFVANYTKGVTDIEYVLPVYALVIMLAQIFYAIRAPYLTLVQGIGHYEQTKNGAIAEAAINVSISVILVQFCGIVGVAVGTLIANMFRTFQYALYIEKKVIHRGRFAFIYKIIIALLSLTVINLISYFPCQYASESWLNWCVCGCIVMAISLIVTTIVSFVIFRKDTMILFKLVKGIIKNRTIRKS